MSEEFPALEHPPIVEVVCGFVFEPVGLGGLSLGVYADERQEDFPEQSIVPALAEGPEFILGNPPLRAMLVSASKVRVVQVQHDRLYVNWRAVGEEYPRFSTRNGKTGLLHDALKEFERLQTFCFNRFGKLPRVQRIELCKIDALEPAKKHWKDLPDLVKLLPVCGAFGEASPAILPELALSFVEHEGARTLVVRVSSIHELPDRRISSIRLETRVLQPLGTDELMETAFVSSNAALNRTFFKLVSPAELHRFGVVGGSHGSPGT